MHAILVISLIALVLVTNGATRYVPANDSQPLLRRDLLPLDVDTIRELANQLAILADGPTPRSAPQLRNRVQAITLSQRLSPAQARARAILASFANGENRPIPEGAETQLAKSNVLATAGWLSKLPSNSEGYRLGQLLLDILQPIAGDDPILQLHSPEDAPKRWKGVVARVTAFEVLKKAVIKKEPEIPEPIIPEGPKYAVTALLTEVPMIAKGTAEGDLPTPGLIKTSLVITPTDAQGELRILPHPRFPVSPLHDALREFFQSIDQPLPKGHRLNLSTDRRIYLEQNQENIAAPLAMMLDAALSGRPLRPNTLLFARLQADGFLTKPAAAWSLLLNLENLRVPNGSRIIVGSGMLEEMTGLLVLEKASFFTKFEVIEAPTFEAARELFYTDGKPSPDLASAIAGYQEVREKANLSTNLNTFLSLSAVESRLIKARDHYPQHLSARMLATQAIRRPAYFTRFMFAQELDRRLEKASQFKYVINSTPKRAVRDLHKETRESIDPLARRIERAESEILGDAVALLKDLSSVGRESSDYFDNEEQTKKEDIERFQKKLEFFRAKLRLIDQPAEKE